MKTRIIKFILAAMLSGGCFVVNAQEKDRVSQTQSFTAKEAVDYALKNAVQVKNALLDIKIQEQTNKGYTAAALPQITGNASLLDYVSIPTSLIPAQFLGGTAGTYYPVKFGTKYNATYGGDIEQLLFDGQVFVGLQARKTALRSVELTAEITKEQIKANVYKIYYELVVGQRQIGTLDANIDTYEKLLHDTKEIYKNGFAEKLDVDKVQVQLSNLETQKLKTQNQLDAGNEGLKFLMNLPQQDQLILTDTLSEEKLKSNTLDENYNYEDRKEYQQLETVVDLDKYNVKRYQLSKIPTLSATGIISQNAQRTEFDIFKGGSGYQWYSTSYIGLKIAIPIFDGGLRNSNIATAKLNLLKTYNNIDLLKSSIDNDVAQSRIKLKSAIFTMDSQKKNIDLAEQVYNSTKFKYEQGLGSNQEISTAQTDLITAQNNYYSALYDAIIAKVNYLQAVGKL